MVHQLHMQKLTIKGTLIVLWILAQTFKISTCWYHKSKYSNILTVPKSKGIHYPEMSFSYLKTIKGILFIISYMLLLLYFLWIYA